MDVIRRSLRFSDDCRQAYEIDRFRGAVDERDIMVATRLLVRPEYRGSDLAVRLFHALLAFAQANGVVLGAGLWHECSCEEGEQRLSGGASGGCCGGVPQALPARSGRHTTLVWR